MEYRPLDIQRFEALQLLTVLVGLIHGFAVRGAIEPIFGALIGVTLTLLISRGRKNWARWTLLVLFVLGAALIIVGSFFGITQEAFSKVYPLLTAVVWIMQAVALVLLFTPQSSNWLRSAPASA
jgi:peptidoglycan/LPS O-acetylase OafA/YrhL